MTENTITCTDFYSLEENIIRNFTANNKLDVLAHTLKVRDNTLILARKYVIDYEQAKNAALLHDISTLIPVENYLSIAEALDLEIFPAEREIPSLLHQRISRIVAVETFNVVDKEVLNAVNCHTTLRRGPRRWTSCFFWPTNSAARAKAPPPTCLSFAKRPRFRWTTPSNATLKTLCSTKIRCRSCIRGCRKPGKKSAADFASGLFNYPKSRLYFSVINQLQRRIK